MADPQEVLQVKEGSDKTEKNSVENTGTGKLQTESEDLRKTENVTDTTNDTSKDIVPDVEIVEDKPLTQQEKTRINFIQNQLVAVFEVSQPRPEGMTDEQFKEHVEKGKKAIQDEQEKGIYGPATKEAYKNMITWVEKQAVPGAITELARLELAIPPGSPIDLPKDRLGRVVSVDYFKQLTAEGRTTPNLGLDASRVPSEDDVLNLSDTMTWIKGVSDNVREARIQQQERLIEKDVKNLIHDPEKQAAWLDRKGSTPEEWRRAAIEAVDLANRVGNYVEAMDSLNRAGNEFAFVKPPGSEIIRDEKGRIKQVKLDLPKDLRLDHPENAAKMQALRKWMDEHGKEIDQAIKELIKLEQEPDRLLFFGEVGMQNTPIRLDAKHDVSEVVNPDNVKGDEVYANLIAMDFDVEETVGEDGKPKIKVSNSVQYQKSEWYNYLNIGAADVGNEIDVPSREYDPEDWVPVRTSGGEVEIMKAKDLSDWKLRRQIFHYGEKALIATLDASMLVTGTIAVGGAVKAARAGQLALTAALKQGAKGALRATIGASGMVNNAYFQNTDYGRKIQVARGLYFVGEAGLGLASGGWKAFKTVRGVESVSAGARASQIVESQIQASKWANRIYRPAEIAATATMYPFAAIIGTDIYHQIDSLDEIGRNDPTRAAIRQAAQGRGDHVADAEKKIEADPKKLAEAELDRYGALLSRDTNPKVKEILDKTKELIQKDASKAEIDAYKAQLVEHFMPDAERIITLEKAGTFKTKKSARHIEFKETQDRSVQTAAALALLQLSKGEDGKLPETLAERTIDIPEYEDSEYVATPNGGANVPVKVDARKEVQDVKLSDITAFLRREIESPKAESRLVASGDLALQLGVANGREVAGVLQDVITGKSASNLEKTEAILRLGATIDALKVQEDANLDVVQQAKEDGRMVGLSSHAIEHFLKNLSSKGDTEEQRAAASLMVFANGETNSDTRQELMRSYAKLLGQNADNPGEFTKKAADVLKAEANNEENSRERRFNASEAMLEFIKGSGKTVESMPNLKVETYKSMASLVDPSDVAISTRVLRTLGSDGINSLDTDENGRVVAKLRENTLEIMQDTLKAVEEFKLPKQSEADRAEFFSVITPVMKGATQIQRSQLEHQLTSLIDADKSNFYYADFSPELRKASIRALTDLGSRGALSKFRQALVGDKTKGISPDEDASVRYEALKSLETLRDPKLRSVALELIGKETDPIVSGRLNDIKFTTDRLDPDSEEYKKKFEETAASLLQDPLRGYDNVKAEIEAFRKTLPANKKSMARELYIRNWMKTNFDLLDGKTFESLKASEGQKAADNEYSGFGGWFAETIWDSSATINRNKQNARTRAQNAVIRRHNNQWDSLIKMANGTGDNSIRAQMAMADVVLNGGQPFSADVAGNVQTNLMAELYNLSKPGVENRDFISWAVKSALTTSPTMDHRAREWALYAMLQLAKPDKRGNSAISREEMATTSALALKLQHENQLSEGDPEFQIKLINVITNTGHHTIYPVFEAIAQESKVQKVKDHAERSLTWMRDSVRRVVIETPVDRTSTDAQLALNIKQSMQDGNTSDQVVEAIIAATKQRGAVNANDARIPVLRIALQSQNERVRLTAAAGLIAIAGRVDVDLSDAVSALRDIEQNSKKQRFKEEAGMFMQMVPRVTPVK